MRGELRVCLASAQRVGYNMISSITNQGRLAAFVTFRWRFTPQVFLEFLRRLPAVGTGDEGESVSDSRRPLGLTTRGYRRTED
jgi:hypothetical protein